MRSNTIYPYFPEASVESSFESLVNSSEATATPELGQCLRLKIKDQTSENEDDSVGNVAERRPELVCHVVRLGGQLLSEDQRSIITERSKINTYLRWEIASPMQTSPSAPDPTISHS